MDTTYIRTQYSARSVRQRQIFMPFSMNGYLKYNVPLKPRLTFHAGVGLDIISFRYRDVDEIVNYSSTRDTLDNYRPTNMTNVIGSGSSGGSTGPAYGYTHDGIPCDSLAFSFHSDEFESHVNTTINLISNLSIPLELSYDLIPNNLNLRVGARVNYALSRSQRYNEVQRYESFNFRDTISLCIDGFNMIRAGNTKVLSSVTIAAVARLEARLNHALKVFASVRSSLNSITDPGVGSRDSNFAISFNYRPVYFNLGMSADLFFNEKGRKRRRNYLIKSKEL